MRSIFFFAALLLLLLLGGAVSPALAQKAVWARSFANFGYANAMARSAATDAAGNTYLVGGMSDTVRVDNGVVLPATVDSLTGNDLLVAKYDPTGQLLWSERIRATRGAVANALVLDPTGNVYVAGRYVGVLTAGTTVLPDTSFGFLAKFTATGRVTWVRSIGPLVYAQRGAYITSMTTDAAGALYLAGIAQNIGHLDGLPMIAGYEQFIIKSNPAGAFQRITHFLNTGIEALTTDASGEVVFGGAYWGGAAFGLTSSGGGVLLQGPTNGDADLFLGRLDALGGIKWIVPGGDTLAPGSSTGQRVAADVAADAHGNAYLTGASRGSAFLGAGTGGSFLLQVRPSGAVGWMLHPGGGPYSAGRALQLSADGRSLFLAGLFTDSVRLGDWTVRSAPGLVSQYIARVDTTGAVRWARAFEGAQSGNVQLTPVSLGCDAADHLYSLSYTYTLDRTAGTFLYDGQVVHTGGPVLLRFNPAARLNGQLFFDANANGRREANELPFPRQLPVTETAQGRTQLSDLDGRFHFFLDSGQYAVPPPVPPAGYRISYPRSGGYAGLLNAPTASVDTLDFGLAPLVNQQDLRVTITPYSAARPGRATHYRVRVENVGTTVIGTGQVVARFDALGQYVGAQPAPTQPPSGQTVTWDFQNLPPFAVRQYVLAVSLPTTVVAGTPVLTQANVTPLTGDQTPADNADQVEQRVTTSTDPNDLRVNYSTLTPAQLAAGEKLDYTVQFQNIGTDTAFAIVIRDSLSTQLLRLGTLEMVGQSHNCEVAVDYATGVLTINFLRVVLPPRNVDVLRSMGFVRFQVKPRATLTPGALIPNTAHIVFDYNAPVTTNQVTTLVQAPNGLVAEPGAEDATMRLYPNPATDQVTLTGAEAGAKVTLFDALGRLVATSHLAPNTSHLDVRGLAPGLYLVRLTQPDGGTHTRRLMVK